MCMSKYTQTYTYTYIYIVLHTRKYLHILHLYMHIKTYILIDCVMCTMCILSIFKNRPGAVQDTTRPAGFRKLPGRGHGSSAVPAWSLFEAKGATVAAGLSKKQPAM